MTAEVKTFRLVNSAVNLDAIELLEGALERVRQGHVLAVAIVEVDRDRTVHASWSGGEHGHELLAGAARLMAKLALADE